MKKILLLLVLLNFGFHSFAQEDDNEYSDEDTTEEFEPIKDETKKLDLSKFRLGGNFGLGFEGKTFFAEVSPTLGYQIIEDRLELGPGIIYQHISQTNYAAINNIGAQAYVRAYVFEGFFAQIDGFIVNKNIDYIALGKKTSYTYGNGFIGVGYALNYKEAPFYMSLSVKTNIITDSTYPRRVIIPNLTFQFRL